MTEQIDKAKLIVHMDNEINKLPRGMMDGVMAKRKSAIKGAYDTIKRAIEAGSLNVEPVSNTDELNRYKTVLRKIVCLNILIPDEVFNLANDALENQGGAKDAK